MYIYIHKITARGRDAPRDAREGLAPVVVLRFPLWVQHTRFKVFTLDTFYETMVFGGGIAVAAHYFAVRLSASTWRCMKAREERRASSVAKTEGSSYRVDDASVERVSRSSA